jgi:hypothetical protein
MRVLLKRGGSRTLDGEDGFRAHGSGFVEKGVTGFVERGFAGLVETEREREGSGACQVEAGSEISYRKTAVVTM